MSRVGIVTDSTNCLPPALIKEYDIRVAPLDLIINGRAYRDQIDITPAEFYRIYRDLRELPTTSGASVNDFITIFEEMAATTDRLACITLSRTLSATYDAAFQAREAVISTHPGLGISLIDSRNAAGTLGFIVLEAARAARESRGLEEVVRVAEAMISRVRFVAALDTMKYLIKGGRAPRVAWLGDLVQLKPIIGLVKGTGQVDALGKVRTKRRALARMADMINHYIDARQPLHINVHYSERIEDGEQLKALITARYHCTETYLTELTPAMSCHTGPMMGVAFYT